MYEKFFNLKTKPFELVPDPEFLYQSHAHKKALTYLKYGIQEKAGFVLLTGEIGVGKTTTIKNVIKDLDFETPLAMVFNTKVNFEQLLAMINDDFGLPAEGKDKVHLLKDLNDFLLEHCKAGRTPIVVIDEAQNLTTDTLEEVRLLSNLEADSFKLIQIILVGQPELCDIIRSEDLTQLRQRIGVSCHIERLAEADIAPYIFHRLEKAGNRDAVSLGDGLVETVFELTNGVPRLINVLCDYMLLTAFIEKTTTLTTELAHEAYKEIKIYDTKKPLPEKTKDPTSPTTLTELIARVSNLEEGFVQMSLDTINIKQLKDRTEDHLKVFGNLCKEILQIAEKTEVRLQELEKLTKTCKSAEQASNGLKIAYDKRTSGSK